MAYKWIGADKAKAVNPVMTQTPTGLSLTWGAPETGVNGGYINTAALTYRVVRQPEGEAVYEGAGTSFAENITITDMKYYWYDVTAIADGTAGETASSNKMKLGTACAMPYTANFNQENDIEWFTVVNANSDGSTYFQYDGSATYEFSTENNADDWLITPPLA